MSRLQRFILVVLALAIWGIGLGTVTISAERPTGSIAGRVASQDGTPLAGARVYLYSEGGRTRVVQTANDGTFRADRLPVDTWRIQARKRGFDAQWLEPEIVLGENEIRRDVHFALMPREATVNFAQYQRVFLPGENVRLGTRGSLVDRLEMALYRLDTDEVLARHGSLGDLTEWESPVPGSRASWAPRDAWTPDEVRRRLEVAIPPAIPRSAVTPLATWSAAIPAGAVDEDDWFYRPVEIPARSEGTYLVTLHAAGSGGRILRDAYWFNVTRLALVAKRSADEILVYAVDFETKKPVAGAEIAVYAGPVRSAGGSTGPDGQWRAPFGLEGQYVTIIGRQGASFAHVSAYHGGSDRLAVYSYTDRPIYRPGDEVHFKGIIRDNRKATPRIPEVSRAVVSVQDSDGTPVFRRDVEVGELGTYSGDFVLPEDGRTGSYSLVTEIGQDRYYSYFEVEAYRKPEFKVEVKPSADRVVGGERLAVAIDAAYYFGAPVSGARVRYVVFSRPEYPGWTEEDGFYGGYSGFDEPMGGEVVAEGEATTDEAGHVDLAIATRKIVPAGPHAATYDQRYVIEVESQDQSRRLVKGKAAFLVTRGQFDLRAEAATYLVRAGEPVRLAILAIDYEGKPVQTRVVVALEREIYVPPRSDEEAGTTRYEAAAVPAATSTDAQGRATIALTAPRGGSYLATVTARDAGGHEITARAWFWASADETAPTEGADGYGALGVTFDKKIYRPGEVARVLITSPVPDLPVLLTIEGERLHEARTLQLKGAGIRLDIPVRLSFQPNVYVTASIVNGKELLTSERSLNVLPADRFLDVTVKPSRERYQPGERARFTVQTRGTNGRPVAGAEVSLGIVDEAVYALAPDRTPDIRRFFLGPRSSDVSTFHSFGTDYSGGPAKDLGEIDVRRNFKDTAAWFPALRTGKDGTATVEFDLPDNLTTWVCTARAITIDTRVGSAVRKVLATKDLLVRLETPRFFTQGDRLQLGAIVHNFTARPQDVQTFLAPGSLELKGPARRSATIEPGAAALASFPVAAVSPGTASIEVRAGNRALGDGMALEVPVKAHGLPEVRSWAGKIAPDAAIPFEVPKTAIPATVRLSVSITPTPWAALLAGLDYLARYPYWCTEQTASRLIPMALAYRQLPEGDGRRAALSSEIAKATRKLLGLQHEAGWGWWESGDTEIGMTAYALWGLATAREAGFDVGADRIGRGMAYLATALPRIGRDTPYRHAIEQGTGPDTRALGLWGMAQALGGSVSHPQSGSWARAFDREVDRLWRERTGLNSYGKALLAEALARVRHPLAPLALADLGRDVKESGSMAHWEAGGGRFTWWNSDVEATSHAVLAYLHLAPEHPLVARAERWLEMNRKMDRWMSTKETAAALAALAGIAASRDDAGAAPYPVEVSLDGEVLATASVDPGPDGMPVRVVLEGDRLAAGRHALRIRAGRPFDRKTPGVAGLPGAPGMTREPGAPGAPGVPGMTGDPGMAEGGDLPGMSARSGKTETAREPLYGAELLYFRLTGEMAAAPGKVIQVERSYHAIPPGLQAEARAMPVSQLFSDRFFPRLEKIRGWAKPGDRIVVRIRVKTTQDVRYAVIEDPLPAGCEVLADESGEGSWWSHRDILDDKVVFFADSLAGGRPHDFYYVMRPEIVGDFHVLPTVAEAMYAPEVRAHGAEDRLEVRE